MERLCERPGCSEPASVAYGMRPEDLVFWLDVLRDRHDGHGVLCRRHADSMVVPRGWTLDDLRDPDLHLFRPPSDDSGATRRPRARRASPIGDHEQLALGVEPAPVEPVAAVASTSVDDPVNVAASQDDAATAVEADDEQPESTPWMPIFDTDDDLDGLLSANSPLLSRAFRGDRSN